MANGAVYLHWDEAPWTVKLPKVVEFDQVLSQFATKYAAKHPGQALRPGELELVDERGSLVDEACWRGLAPKSDVFVRRKKNIAAAVVRQAEAALAAKNYRKAKELLEAVLRSVPGDASARHLLAETFLRADKPEDALPLADTPLMRAKALYGLDRRTECVSACDEAIPNMEALVLMSDALLWEGHLQPALTAAEAALGQKSDDASATRVYAGCARKMGKYNEELSLLMRAIVLDSKDKDVRRALAKALSSERSLERLEELLGSAATSSAVAFLATIAKDHGVCDTAVDLMRMAVKGAPESASYALNLLHAHEICADSDQALAAGLSFFKAAKEREGLVRELAAAIFATGPSPERLEWVDHGDNLGYATVEGAAERPKTRYDDDQLDALALAFAVTKLTYLNGDLDEATRLVADVEPFRRASVAKLHETTIRNEHAYYCCVAQILAVDPERRRGHGSRQIHVVGDSHALSPAWKRWTRGDDSFVLVPALVTGLKHWHLRPETDFYPKRNFYYVVRDGRNVVPEGATVVFVLGEIDCREGILVAVQKLRYESIDEGIDATIAHFIAAARDVVKSRKYEAAFVHPIPPVLDETRPVVIKYNARLEYHVKRTPELTWLDFFDGFLTSDHRKLRSDWRLDGTHLHPKYLDELLIPALSRHL